MKNYSIWKENVNLPSFKKLYENKDVDVLIIGGGMTGINALYQLATSSLEVLLVEQNKIGMGVTANSTGKLTYLQGDLYEKIIKNFDVETARRYLDSQKDAIDLACDIIEGERIDCNLLEAPSYVYSLDEEEDKKLDDLKKFLTDYNINVIEGENELIEYKRMIGVENTYIFHPLKYILGLVNKIDASKVYEDTSIV